ncbi:MAG: hypothetical protein ABSD85_14565 [Acidimicrobiales bacterium]
MMLPTIAPPGARRATNSALVSEATISSRAARSGATAVVESCGRSRAMTSTSSSVTSVTRSTTTPLAFMG